METRIIDNRVASTVQHAAAIEPAIPHTRQLGAVTTHQPMDAENPSAGLQRYPQGRVGLALPPTVEEANTLANTAKHGISFALDHDSERIVVRVINQKTGEVIQQIPSEEFLNLLGRMHQTAGIFVDNLA